MVTIDARLRSSAGCLIGIGNKRDENVVYNAGSRLEQTDRCNAVDSVSVRALLLSIMLLVMTIMSRGSLTVTSCKETRQGLVDDCMQNERNSARLVSCV
jgi:hypothetical protein